MRTTLAMALSGLVMFGCSPQPGPLPDPAPLTSAPDEQGFPIKPRPGCSVDVIAASRDPDPASIGRLAARGGNFTCGPREEPLPLDEAVINDHVPRVRALLEAKADPNARWSTRGDRFPLQEAIEARSYANPSAHRAEIMQLLLEHGADPNQRWCPFESRGGSGGCVSKWGTTPLLMAVAINDAAATFLLLGAGADPLLEDSYGANALDVARGEAVLYLVLSAIPQSVRGHGADVIAYLNKRNPKSSFAGPWDELPLARAIVGNLGGGILPPPPPPEQREALGVVGPSDRIGRVRALLSLGANPSQHLTWGGADWTPLGLAVAIRDTELVVELLRHGADKNARWCVPIQLGATRVLRREPGCTEDTGITAVMFAASLGQSEIVRWLSRQGADLSLQDWQNQTALDHALRARHEDIARDLRQAARLRSLAPH
jgi:ankyrin repeat protein